MTVPMRASIYKLHGSGKWQADVYEPDDDGYMVVLTADGEFDTWAEAMAFATSDDLTTRRGPT